MTDPPAQPKPPLYKRRSFIVAGVVVVIAAITVVTDLPANATRASQISGDKTVIQEVDSDVGPCAFAANESFEIWKDEQSGTLSASDLSRVPGLLRDDQSACSFTSDSIYELSSDIEVPQSSSGKPIGQMVGTVTLWATSDALAAIEAIQTLVTDPHDASALSQLHKSEGLLASDRATAESELEAADKVLSTKLPGLNLPSLPLPPHS